MRFSNAVLVVFTTTHYAARLTSALPVNGPDFFERSYSLPTSDTCAIEAEGGSACPDSLATVTISPNIDSRGVVNPVPQDFVNFVSWLGK